MNLATFHFLIAFLPVAVIGFFIFKRHRLRQVWLLLCGSLFLAYADWRSLPFIFTVAIGTFFTAQAIEAAFDRKRRWLMYLGVSAQIATLMAAIYLGLFAQAFSILIPGVNQLATHIEPFTVLFGIGISFSSFQYISYTIDVFRKTIPAERDILTFLSFATFFPNRVSGPIARYGEVHSAFANLSAQTDPAHIQQGILLIICGLSKKILIADFLGRSVNNLWNDPGTLSAPGAWIAIIGYGLQLLMDFSGYSDMAIGAALLFGIKLPQNFDRPYLARSPSDFWRRWHMSLGTWMREYLYFPLGGSRGGVIRTMINLMVVMIIVGLWHGPNWTFVVWGLIHGVSLALYHLTRSWWDRAPLLMQRAATFLFITLTWVFFRSPSMASAQSMFHALFQNDWSLPTGISTAFYTILIIALVVAWWLPEPMSVSWSTKKRTAIVFAILLVACLLFMNYQQATFIYYQF